MTTTNDRLAEIRARLTESGEIENERNNNLTFLLSLVEQLQGQLDEFATLQDRIPDDGNGDWGLGWDHGYNAALAEVRAMAARPPAQEHASGSNTPDPYTGEGTAPASPHEPAQAAIDTIARVLVGTDWDEEVPYTDIGPRDTVAHLARRIIAATHEAEGAPERVDTTTAPGGAAPGPAPLTLAQAAGHLHDWARDLDDGTRTDWPAGHPDIIRGIRAAAEWLDARDRYETETREQHLTALREAGRRLGESFQQLGEAIRDGAAKARAAREAEETPEPAEPTWRDVIRTMRGAGIRLERIGDHGPGETFRRWDLLDMHGDEVGWFEHETSWLGEDWEIELGESAPKFSARSSELFAPADVLTLARLAGLIGDTDG